MKRNMNQDYSMQETTVTIMYLMMALKPLIHLIFLEKTREIKHEKFGKKANNGALSYTKRHLMQ